MVKSQLNTLTSNDTPMPDPEITPEQTASVDELLDWYLSEDPATYILNMVKITRIVPIAPMEGNVMLSTENSQIPIYVAQIYGENHKLVAINAAHIYGGNQKFVAINVDEEKLQFIQSTLHILTCAVDKTPDLLSH